jgi:probable phosphoglycerate mutase
MRHGDVDYFAPDGRPYRPAVVALNDQGRLQAEAAGHELAAIPLDRVVTSGLRRSVETAEFAVGPHKLVAEIRSDLREIEPGRLLSSANSSPEEVADAFLGALAGAVTADTPFLGGETFGALADRVWPAFTALLAEPGWWHLLIVAHGVVNRVLLTRMLGSGLAGIGAIEQDAGCVNVIDVNDDGRFLVRLLNHSPLNALKLGVELTTMERLYEQYLQTRG